MATPAELAFERTNLDEDKLAHLQRLLGTWGILADLSFSDLVLMAPMAPDLMDPRLGGLELVILGQMRPSNSSTVVEHDLVGQTVGADVWPLVVLAFESGEPSRGEIVLEPGDEPVRLHCIPVRCEGRPSPSWPACRPAPAVGPVTSSAPTGTSSTASP